MILNFVEVGSTRLHHCPFQRGGLEVLAKLFIALLVAVTSVVFFATKPFVT
jgi:hypothetical protein